MNEVRAFQSVPATTATRSASSAGAVDAKTTVAEGGKGLPETNPTSEVKATVETKESSQGQSLGNVETAVAKINDYVQSIQRDLQFTVDEDLDKTVVKVVDGHSGELIRQIPGEVFLELARKLNEDGELRLVKALG